MWRRLILAVAIASCGDGDDTDLPPATFGSAVITWSLADASGNPLTCQALGFTHTSVSLGRETFEVPCGDDQRVTFLLLTPGRYGVTIRLEVTGRGALITQTDNVEVVANQEVVRDVVVEVDGANLDDGSIMFRWTIAGLPAAANCDALGAETIHFVTASSSIEQFELNVPCSSGEIVIEPLSPGVYEVLAEMRDVSGTRISSPQSFDIRVRAGERSTQTIAFFQDTGERATFHGLWTITSSSAADACEDVAADRVRVSIQTLPIGRQGVEIATATAACELGEITIPDLLGGPNQVRATFVLVSNLVGTLDTVTSTAFFLVSARTATIAGDFDLQ